MRRSWSWRAAATALALAGGVTLVSAVPSPARATAAAPEQLVLSPEGNHLWAYDASTGDRQLVARAQNGGDPGAAAPNGLVRDINGQVCVAPDGEHIITGEDTVLPAEGPGAADGAGSHDPRIAGWGWFSLEGDSLGELVATQVGKLAPEAGTGPGYTGDPDNYGCGFLDAQRLLTTAIGNTLPGEPANGQLFLWFGPFERGFREERDPDTGVGFHVGEVDHCEIDHTLATAGGIAVDDNGDVYVATNRPTEIPGGDPSAVWRYSGTWPRSVEECTPEYVAAHITKTRVLPAGPAPLPADPLAPTPSAVVISPTGTLFVSSVFSGTVSEFTLDGQWVRDVYPLSPVSPRTGPTGQTPFGMAISADGSLWIADLGIVTAQPAPGQGSLIRVPFADGAPGLPETVQDGLTFPDGVGIYTPSAGAPRPPAAPSEPATQTDTSGRLPATGSAVPMGTGALLVVLALITRRFR